MSDDPERSTSPPPESPAPPAPPPAPEPQADAELWRERAEAAERELAFRRALASVAWFDPEDAYRELAQSATRDASGQWHVQLGGKDAKPLRLNDAVRELAAKKPHWVKARVIAGSGASGGSSGGGTPITYADLLKPENRDKLREYLYERPEELERLRQSHFKN
ncbi:MAG TPA: hypothetical protein VEJ63_08885 [Planctomycetota bacterium]|nr:hypothetical protein [Planctomycetota bacterium]